VPFFFVSFLRGMLAPVLPLYAGSFGVSYGLIGLLLAGEALGTLAADLPSGLLLRRLGARRTALVGVACAALCTLACSWARSVPEALLYQALGGAGAACYHVALHAYLTGATTVNDRGRAIATYGGIMRIGGFAGPAVGGALASAGGLRLPFAVAGAGYVTALGLITVYLRPSDGRAGSAHSGLLHLAATVRGRYRTVATAGVAQIMGQTIRAGRAIVIPLYAADVLGLDVSAIGIIVSLSSAVDMSLFYPAGLLMDRLGRKFAIVPSFIVQAAGMALIPLTGSFGSLLGASMLMGFGNGLGSGTMMTLGSDLAPPQSRSEFLGAWRLIGDTGFSAGPLAVGGLADLFVLPIAIWAVSATGLGAALICLLFVPETLRADRRAEG